jgi:hypothetical protein
MLASRVLSSDSIIVREVWAPPRSKLKPKAWSGADASVRRVIDVSLWMLNAHYIRPGCLNRQLYGMESSLFVLRF